MSATMRQAQIIITLLGIALTAGYGYAQTLPAPEVLIGTVWGLGAHRHAKAEAMTYSPANSTFTMSGTMNVRSIPQKRNVVSHFLAHGTLCPGALPYEYVLNLQYDEAAYMTCNSDTNGVFSCQFGPLAPSLHQEVHDCYGDPAVRLDCVQERAFDPEPIGQQSPAEFTVWTPLP